MANRSAVSKFLRKFQSNGFDISMVHDLEEYDDLSKLTPNSARLRAVDIIMDVEVAKVKVYHEQYGVVYLTVIPGNGDDEILADWSCSTAQHDEVDELIESIVFD